MKHSAPHAKQNLPARFWRGRAVLVALVGLTIVLSTVLGAIGRGLSIHAEGDLVAVGLARSSATVAAGAALLVGSSGGILLFKGWPALDELRGTQIVLLSRAELHHAVQYGLMAVAAAGGTSCDLGLRMLGYAMPWSFPGGTLMFVVVPLSALALLVAAPRASRWIGLGVPRS